jgi:integrase
MPPHHEPRRLPAGRAVRPREAQNQNKRVIPAVVLSDGYSPLWHLAFATGLRRGELIGLRWQDVGEKRGTIAVVQNVVAYKGAALIEEPKTPAAWRGLDLIFTTPDGGPLNPNNVSRNFALLLTKAEKQRKADHPDLPPFPRIRFHDMRHTHATLLLQKGEAVHTVSARLGHANPAITLGIYAHVTPSMQESAASTIGRLLSDVS